ncbi:hypothetical protein A8G00_23080 [Sphingobium sp. SA916]|nr:hypothetical protein A8G00_23080 [Sphingobium sp. SA916]
MTQNVAGPFCTQILADFGAEVIKVERPKGGDDTRHWMPPEIEKQSATFLALNRGKSSIGVDIDRPGGQDAIRALVASCDVVVHSMKPGSLEKRGLGYDALSKINPRLIFCELSAFGQTGPFRDLPGYDPLLQAFTGIMSVTGHEGDRTARVGVSLIDMGTGIWLALGIMAAILARSQDGKGRRVSASLMETGVSWMTIVLAGFFATGKVPAKLGSATAMTAPYELFEAADGSLFISAGNDRLFQNVCRSLDIAELLEDDRFRTNSSRVINRAALHDAIERRTREETVASLIERLRAAGAPCAELHDVSQVASHPQVTSAGILQPLPIDEATDHKVVGLPITLDGHRPTASKVPPRLGEDTDAILAAAGIDQETLKALRVQGAII